MTDLRLAPSPSDALAGADHVVLAAPASALRRRPWKGISRAAWTKLAARLAGEAEAGELGGAASAMSAAGSPRRVTVVALPDAVSPHLGPSRHVALSLTLAKAELPGAGRTAVLLVVQEAEHLLPLALAVARRLPTYDRRTKGRPVREVRVAAVGLDGEGLAFPSAVKATVDAARWTADLVDRPAAELSTADFVEQVEAALRRRKGVHVRVLAGDELLAHGLGGIHGVGRAATVPPRLLLLEHAPKGAARTVALVGKGVVFDTGGLALKPREGMFGMKGDMGGAAAVAGAFQVLLRERLPVRMVAVLPLAENAIGPGSYRPGDVLTLHSGRTVEINNTDAEGRLLLHDGVSWAARELGADVVLDAATLTGAQPMATGRRMAAVVSDSAALERLAVDAGRRTGDVVHPMPWVPELHRREFRSHVADMLNSVRDRASAQVSCAAWFVHQGLAGTGVPWLHVDLAGPAHVDERGTGFGVALLAEVVRGWARGEAG
jgi:probable aminopeptidase NPEPL1